MLSFTEDIIVLEELMYVYYKNLLKGTIRRDLRGVKSGING
jgi:hypothetical protein